MSKQNLPRHGDPIVTPSTDSFGGVQYPATAQFQRFLDELAELVDNLDSVVLDTLLQEVAGDKASFTASIAQLLAATSSLQDDAQEVYALKALIHGLRVSLYGVQELGNDLAQEVAAINAQMIRHIPEQQSAASVYAFNRVIGTGTQAVTSTLTAITWNASNDSFGSDVTYSGANPTRLTVQSDGVYRICGYAAIQSTAQRAQAALEILVNGVATGFQRSGSYIRNSGTAYDYWTMDITSTPFNLSASDYVELGIGQVTGATYGYAGALTINCDRSVSEFWLERVA